MSKESERLKRRQQRRKLQRTSQPDLHVLSRGSHPNEVSHVSPLQSLDDRYSQLLELTNPVECSLSEGDRLIQDIRSRWSDDHAFRLTDVIRENVLGSVVSTFGLGALVASKDQRGGNISTPQNAERGVFASEEDRKRFEPSYARNPYDEGLKERRKADLQRAFDEKTPLRDAYTGRELPRGKDGRHDGRSHLDHVVSTKEVHEGSSLRRLTASVEERARMAKNEANLAYTADSANMSKRDLPMSEWLAKVRKDGRTNAEYFEIDRELASDRDAKARQYIERETYVLAGRKYAHDSLSTGAKEGLKMGLQQAFGLLIGEFLSSTLDEVMDSMRNGIKHGQDDTSYLRALAKRVKRIAKRCAERAQDAWQAFAGGAVSGFLSNLATAIINFFVTTSKRLVRIIREGFFSIGKAIKTFLFPPPGTTNREAADAALKLLATAIVSSGGIVLEEIVEKAVTGFFSTTFPLAIPLAGPTTAVLVGALTGIASALVVYGIERLDPFGVRQVRDHAAIMAELHSLSAKAEARSDALIGEILGSPLARHP